MLIIALVKSWRVCTTESDEPSAEAWVRSVVSEVVRVVLKVSSWALSANTFEVDAAMPRLVLLMAKALPVESWC